MFLNTYVRSRFALACFVALGVITLVFLKYRAQDQKSLKQSDYTATFAVDTIGCKIPNFDPYDPLIGHLVNESVLITCPALPALTYTDSEGFLRINRTVLRVDYNDTLDYCEYQRITRPAVSEANADNTFRYERPIEFREDVHAGAEHLRVACYGEKSGALIYTNFHATVLVKPEVEQRCERDFSRFVNKYRPLEVLNMLILGVDSVSRLNFIRHMKETRNFLLEELEGVELMGYNKVADNTYVNLVPMFSGRYVEELPWDETKSDVPFDNFTFIWNNYSSYGYRTLYAEDAPQIAIFNYNKAGFLTPPSDYYLRPFSLALEDHGSLWRGGSAGPRDCVGGKLETQKVLDYIYDFEERFRVKPHLSFSFITRLTHEHINKAASADQPYYQFFRRLHENGLLNNTAVLFYSDHGMRFGELRETYVGKMEERLPFLVMALPKHFRHKYPQLVAALRLNAERLTTPFDIYETLRDLILFREERHRARPRMRDGELKRGYSLMSEEVPEDRTCESAGILPHWCTCHSMQRVSTGNRTVIELVEKVVGHINDQLIRAGYRDRCAVLALDKIIDAQLVVPYNELVTFQQSLHDVLGRVVKYIDNVSETQVFNEYQLTFRARPSGAMFEATVRHYYRDRDRLEVAEISRINEYGNQSHCVETHRYKKFCYCIRSS